VLTSECNPEKQSAEQQAAQAAAVRERRGAPRHLIKQRCIISVAGIDGPVSGWNCIAYNISATGIGVLLPLAVAPGTLLQIEPWGLTDAPTLLARVVYSKPLEFVAMCGCELTTPLRKQDLEAWLKRVAT